MKKKVGSFSTQHIQLRVALSEWKKKSVLLVHNTFNIESHCLNENTHSPGKKVMIKQIEDKQSGYL